MKQNPDLYKIRCDIIEYMFGELFHCCKKSGIIIDPASSYSPPLDGVARYLREGTNFNMK